MHENEEKEIDEVSACSGKFSGSVDRAGRRTEEDDTSRMTAVLFETE